MQILLQQIKSTKVTILKQMRVKDTFQSYLFTCKYIYTALVIQARQTTTAMKVELFTEDTRKTKLFSLTGLSPHPIYFD